VLVASSAELLAQDTGDLWDSGEIRSDQSAQIAYAGQPLTSSQQVFWKVRAWDKAGAASRWSQPASWTMGIADESGWRANWIELGEASPSVLLRREFDVKPGLQRAVVHVCGLGQYEMTFNGKKTGNALLSPGWTSYRKTCLYDTYDVTALLRAGRNGTGLLLGNGMYNVTGGRYAKFKGTFGPLKAIAQLRLEYSDGSTELVVTDRNWRASVGPITFSCVYGGEDYDARLAAPGRDEPGFDDSKWTLAVETQGPGGELKGLSCAAPPIRAFDVLKPVSVTELRLGVRVYDLGQNAALMPRITVQGAPSSTVRIIPAELLKGDGSVDRESSAHGAGPAWWQYTLAGDGSESWFPKFFYHGCRYL
jgi:alpha-L-rhamnosidase